MLILVYWRIATSQALCSLFFKFTKNEQRKITVDFLRPPCIIDLDAENGHLMLLSKKGGKPDSLSYFVIGGFGPLKGDTMKGWVKLALTKLKEAYNCDHTVGIYYDYSGTDTVLESEMTTEKATRHLAYFVSDISFFDYCPDCGEKLPYKEKYKDAVEMV